MSSVDKDEEDIKKVRELYDSGVPLFTKEAIRHVGDQLAKVIASGRPSFVCVKNLEGDVGEFTVGKPHMRWDNDSSQTQYKAIIDYRGLNLLVYQGAEESADDRLSPLRLCTRTIDPKPNFKLWPVEVLAQRFFLARSRWWDSSSECANLRALINETPMPNVRKIVAFGCGALDSGDLGSLTECDHCSDQFFCHSMQHAFILTLRECLQDKQQGPPIRLIAQDPDYSDTDKQMLQDAGIEIVEDPDGWLEVESDTIVFSMLPSVPVRQIIADIATPAAMIWHKVESAPPTPSIWDDESSPRVVAMVRDDRYTEMDFIECDEKSLPGTAFAPKTAIYIRNDHEKVE